MKDNPDFAQIGNALLVEPADKVASSSLRVGLSIRWSGSPCAQSVALRADDYGCFSLIGSLAEGDALRINYAIERGG